MSNEVYNPDLIDNDSSSNGNNTNADNGEKVSFIRSIKTFFDDIRTRLIIGSIMGLFAIYILVTLYSFLNTGTTDISSISGRDSIEIAQIATESTTNEGGAFGAKLGQFLINDGIGLSAFLIPLWIILMTLSIYKIKKFSFFKTTLSCIMLAIGFTLLAGYLNLLSLSPINWGGLCGREVNLFMVRWIGDVGTISVILMVWLLIAIMWIFSIIAFFKKVISWIPKPAPSLEEDDDEASDIETTSPTQSMDNSSGFDIDNEENEENIDETEHNNHQPGITQFESDDSEIQDAPVAPAPQSSTTTSSNEIETTVTIPTIETAQSFNSGNYDPTKELSHYKFPPIDLLKVRVNNARNTDLEEQENNKKRITETLLNYGIPIKKIEVCVGPTVTLFEIVPDDGVRIAKIKNLENDIALSLAALGIRIIAPIPGKGTIGIEVPNRDPQVVSMRSIIESKKYQECKQELPMAIGCSITNEVFIADLCKMPHILVAGATGQGKSVGLNAIITSLIYRKHPAELKFVLIDPKMVEFSLYSKLEHHYLAKLPGEEEAIITDPKKVVATLNSLTVEMDTRYALLKKAGSRNIQEYNAKFVNRSLNPEKGHRYLPYIVLIVDEFADLIMTSGKEVETPIARIAQKARAIGIHMIIATQRPSTDVITGMIKANFPGRIAFRVAQMVDSRTILDCPGAQQLIGRGDMLFLQNGEMERLQCALIETSEVESICDHIDCQMGYESAYMLPEYIPENEDGGEGHYGTSFDKDALFDEAAEFVVTSGVASTSSLQRRYSIGYNRAGKIMDQMEAAGIVGPSQGGKPRQVLIDSIQLTQILGK